VADVQWKLYYPNGVTYSDRDGQPENAPGVGLQVIVQADPDHGWLMITGGNQGRRDDFFWWDDKTQRWFNGDYPGLLIYLIRPGWRKVVFGESIGNDAFHEIKQRALNDPDFPPKTGKRKYER
jgi:hypothetical protein